MYHDERPDPDLSVPEPPENELLEVLKRWKEVMNEIPLLSVGRGDTMHGLALLRATHVAIENAEKQQDWPRIVKRAQPRIVICVACNARTRLSLGYAPGDLHEGCSRPNGLLGYWTEEPQEDEFFIEYPNGMSRPVPPAPDEYSNPLEDAEIEEALLELDTRREQDLPIEKEDPGGELEKEYYLRGMHRR